MADIALWLQSLSEEERARIQPVLERDLEFQRREKARVRRLRSHVDVSQAKSLASLSQQQPNFDFDVEESTSPTGRSCFICNAQLGYLFKSGADCPSCRQRVCINCRKNTQKSWLCPLCYTEREYVAASGDWFNHSITEPAVSEVLLLELQKTSISKQSSSSQRGTPAVRDYSAARLRKSATNQGSRPLSLQPFTDSSTRRRCRSSSQRGSTDDGSESGTSRSRRSTVSTAGNETPPPDAPKAVIPSLTIENVDRLLSTDSDDFYGSQASSLSSSSYRSSWTSPELNNLLQSPLATPIKAYSTGQLPNRTNRGRRNRKDEEILQAPTTYRATSNPNVSNVGLPTTAQGEKLPKVSSNTSTVTDAVRNASIDDSLETVSLYSQTSHKSSVKSGFRSSMTSLTEGGNIQGDVLLRLHYNCRQGALEVYIDQCRNLIENKRAKPNPYVKLYLYPCEGAEDDKRKTKTKRQTSDPMFQEVLKYPGLTKSELDKRSLFVSVWHNDFFGRNSFLGEIRIDLADYPWHLDEVFCYPLGPKQDRDPPDPMQPLGNKRGTLHFSVKFTPPDPTSRDVKKQKSGNITCTVISAHAAHGHPPEVAIAPFVKGCLYLDEKHSVRLKTPQAKLADGQDPTWNHSFFFQGHLLTDLPQR
uniref:Synaptotagmin-like protein 3 n=1 Tax=Plectus sambesii TaxID=2011161 RepID=A0A914VVP3_9BILA